MLAFINHDDKRSLEFMEEFIKRQHYVSDSLKDMKYADVIYLGMKGIDRKNRLVINHETITLSQDLLMNLKENCLIVTLVHNAYLEELSSLFHFRYIALCDDEQFVSENAILSGEGLISYLISHRINPLYKSRILVLGYGHCGKVIVSRLKGFEANILVAIRNHQYQKEIEDNQAKAIDFQDIDLSQIDILINTVPTHVVNDELLEKANPQIMIVDIASYPYGLNHHFALEKGLNSLLLPSIPCKYAYGYAGKLIADAIERMMSLA